MVGVLHLTAWLFHSVLSFKDYAFIDIYDAITGALEHFKESMGPNDKLRLVVQLMEGVEFLHRKSVVHAGLSPSSLLISQTGNLLISEFSKSIALKVCGEL